MVKFDDFLPDDEDFEEDTNCLGEVITDLGLLHIDFSDMLQVKYQQGLSRLAIQQSLGKLELLKKSLMQEYFG